jgi:hypothetical protein
MLGVTLLWLLLAGGDSPAQDAQPTEYQIKAAFLFRFAKFVEWPAKAFSSPDAPLVIGVLGDNPFHDDLPQVIQKKTVDAHPVAIQEFRSAAEVTNCHILFISSSEKGRTPQILATLKGSSILTVAEMDKFIEAGGMINFFMEGTKIHFQINNDSAVKAGLKISSRMLILSQKPR